jgi:hypothetical protein
MIIFSFWIIISLSVIVGASYLRCRKQESPLRRRIMVRRTLVIFAVGFLFGAVFWLVPQQWRISRIVSLPSVVALFPFYRTGWLPGTTVAAANCIVYGILSLLLLEILPPPKLPSGKCPNCGYDLRGNVSGVCPECGRSL